MTTFLISRLLNLSSKLDVSGLRLAQAMISQSDLEDGMAVRATGGDGFVVCTALHCTAVDRVDENKEVSTFLMLSYITVFGR